MNKMRTKLLIIIALFVLWTAASIAPVFYSNSDPKGIPGFSALFVGWLYLDLASWLANIILFFALLFFIFNRFTVAIILSVITLAMMLNFLRVDFYHAGTGISTKEPITDIGLGYWAWVLSALTLLFGSLMMKKNLKRS